MPARSTAAKSTVHARCGWGGALARVPRAGTSPAPPHLSRLRTPGAARAAWRPTCARQTSDACVARAAVRRQSSPLHRRVPRILCASTIDRLGTCVRANSACTYDTYHKRNAHMLGCGKIARTHVSCARPCLCMGARACSVRMCRSLRASHEARTLGRASDRSLVQHTTCNVTAAVPQAAYAVRHTRHGASHPEALGRPRSLQSLQ